MSLQSDLLLWSICYDMQGCTHLHVQSQYVLSQWLFASKTNLHRKFLIYFNQEAIETLKFQKERKKISLLISAALFPKSF